MNEREQRGLALAALYRIEEKDGKWLVPSQTGNGTRYEVDPNPEHPHCTCPDHTDRGVKCKHMFAVEFTQTRERNADGTETVTRTFKVTEKITYRQDWPNYNKAQTNEKRHFLEILSDLCSDIPEPAPKDPLHPGRPRHRRGDMIFALMFKVYSAVSSRRFNCDLQDLAAKGLIRKAACHNMVWVAMSDPELTPILKSLVIETSKPLAAVETDFAVDSTGFATSRFGRWFDHKYGQTMELREWVKVHIMTGVKTNVVTAVEILDKHASDNPQLPALVNTTAQSFTVKEVSADSAYSGRSNMEAVAAVGGTPYIAFRENATGAAGGLFAKMFHFYRFSQSEFLKHYHKRSNVESTFAMIKAKFGDAVRSKTAVAMVNETLCKLVCHNICCLIHSMYELGIEATFWKDEENERRESALMDEQFEALAWM